MSAARDGLRVWDAERGQLIRLVDGTGGIYRSGFALSPSGNLLATEAIQILETTGWQTRALLTGLRDWLTCCCFSADERTVISGSMDNTARVWDIVTGKQLHSIKTTGMIDACASLADGRVILLEDDLVRIWEPASGHSVKLPRAGRFLTRDLAVKNFVAARIHAQVAVQ